MFKCSICFCLTAQFVFSVWVYKESNLLWGGPTVPSPHSRTCLRIGPISALLRSQHTPHKISHWPINMETSHRKRNRSTQETDPHINMYIKHTYKHTSIPIACTIKIEFGTYPNVFVVILCFNNNNLHQHGNSFPLQHAESWGEKETVQEHTSNPPAAGIWSPLTLAHGGK